MHIIWSAIVEGCCINDRYTVLHCRNKWPLTDLVWLSLSAQVVCERAISRDDCQVWGGPTTDHQALWRGWGPQWPTSLCLQDQNTWRSVVRDQCIELVVCVNKCNILCYYSKGESNRVFLTSNPHSFHIAKCICILSTWKLLLLTNRSSDCSILLSSTGGNRFDSVNKVTVIGSGDLGMATVLSIMAKVNIITL